MPPTAPLIDWSFLAQLGLGILIVAVVVHAATRAYQRWLDPRVPVIDAPVPPGVVEAIPTPIPFVDTELGRCWCCKTPRSSLSTDECLHCGAELIGLFVVAQGIDGIDERMSLAERRLHHQREWLCLHSDQLMLLADLVVIEAHFEGRIDEATLAQWAGVRAKFAAMKAQSE